MRRLSLPFLIAFTLSGCLSSSVKQLGVGHYRLESSYSTRAELEAATANNLRRAEALCKNGYVKRKDYDRLSGSRRILTWEIGCSQQYHPELHGPRSSPH